MSADSRIQQSPHSHKISETTEAKQFFKNETRCRMMCYITATLSMITAIIYFLIGLNFLTVSVLSNSQLFGFFAGVAYGFGALMLFTVKDRLLWILGAIFQIFVIYTYFSFASQRLPEFEVWGIVLFGMQLLILVGLVFLIIRTPGPVKRD